MALPASVPTGTVTGTWYTPSGALAVGTIVFLLLASIEVPDDPDGVVIPVRTVVDVPAGVLNQTLPEGVYQVSMRLSELYRVTKVVEIVEGTALNLPDAVGMLLPDPDLYDPVRSVNGHFPDAYGNIFVPGGGGEGGVTDHGALTGLSDDDHPQYHNNARGDARYALIAHSHIISNVTGLQTALDGKQPSGDYATNTGLSNGLATKQPVGDYATNTDLTNGLASKQPVGDYSTNTALTAVKHRVVVVRDISQSPGYTVAANGDAWALLPGSPEYTITAVVGEHIKVTYGHLVSNEADWAEDLVVVTGGTPVIQKYLSTNTSSPSFSGNPVNYPVGQPFIGRSGSLSFIAESGDLDTGTIRIRWAVKASAGGGILYAGSSYPLNLTLENLRTPL